ncbi:ERV/ALR sulfhydryl oxidase domain-containing protein [Epithele typhae]|uniref:ERV/ALR sulfhydryl oxidase domain-containing protein n=1 Tax=Epithele typhae TaxID=378194 RepID=UPI00200733AB|nr:ERV/ALR sulfhydryl oxidase domain-containing protein [Epithele typhae]KAH9912780.1 ERV/ALR sulfhydryl oxidase domain-containing protein [Epithele typhae]
MITRFGKAFIFTIFALFLVGSLAFFHPPSRTYVDTWTGDFFSEGGYIPPAPDKGVKGNVIMSKLGNATAKAELGRATWKLMHTMTLRYPDEPSQDERDALYNYFHLTSRLYPCGECAAEFQLLLKKFPPQTSSRRSAATWLCFLHNQVNARLGKPEFDCVNLDATYDCGCGDEPLNPSKKGLANDPMDLETDPSRDKAAMGLIKGGR